MGFYLNCVIAPASDDEASAILATVPASAKQRRFLAPWPGVIFGFDPNDGYDYDPEDGLVALSQRFAHLSFAYIEVQCFGGECDYRGYVLKNGEKLKEADGWEAHVELLRAAGAPQEGWFFQPFTRAFWKGEPATEIRRPILGHVSGKMTGSLDVLAIMLLEDLKPPWKLSKMVDTWLVSYGEDDLLISLNQKGDEIEIKGSSHLADPRDLLKQLSDACDCEIVFVKR